MNICFKFPSIKKKHFPITHKFNDFYSKITLAAVIKVENYFNPDCFSTHDYHLN